MFPFDKTEKFYRFEDINLANEASIKGETIKPVLIIDPITKSNPNKSEMLRHLAFLNFYLFSDVIFADCLPKSGDHKPTSRYS